jgi:hypothetical protein
MGNFTGSESVVGYILHLIESQTVASYTSVCRYALAYLRLYLFFSVYLCSFCKSMGNFTGSESVVGYILHFTELRTVASYTIGFPIQ